MGAGPPRGKMIQHGLAPERLLARQSLVRGQDALGIENVDSSREVKIGDYPNSLNAYFDLRQAGRILTLRRRPHWRLARRQGGVRRKFALDSLRFRGTSN